MENSEIKQEKERTQYPVMVDPATYRFLKQIKQDKGTPITTQIALKFRQDVMAAKQPKEHVV